MKSESQVVDQSGHWFEGVTDKGRRPDPNPVATTPKVAAIGLSKRFYLDDTPLSVLEDVSIAEARGEFVSIIGPSGCGKSTLFNLVNGLEDPSSGTVLVDGEDVTGRVGVVGYMPQKDLLLPWRTVLDNTIIGLELSGMRRKEARTEALRWFPLFGLAGFEREYPAKLSGGMRQRAALLRTVLGGREILLLDEPFGALDSLTRLDMQEWLLDIWERFEKTILFVTHDIDEAIYLSDRIFVLTERPGRIQAVFDVALPRPRSQSAVLNSPLAAHLKRQLVTALRAGRRGENV